MAADPLPPPVFLPPPAETGGSSVMEALAVRRTIREIAATPLPTAILSTLLWAAFGVNRAAGPFGAAGRTAASASNSQEIELYVVLPQGAYRYEAAGHRLRPIAAGDLRPLALTPRQHGVVASAPVQIVYVVDIDRLEHTIGFDEPGLHDTEVQKSYYFVDLGLIAGNVSLFAAAHGLAAWFHNCDKARLAERLKLGASQKALFAHSVGYPANA